MDKQAERLIATWHVGQSNAVVLNALMTKLQLLDKATVEFVRSPATQFIHDELHVICARIVECLGKLDANA
jgi:hypothetical protein